MKWELLIKKGYEITNKRVLGNPLYASEETRNKDLIQELALVQYWLIKTHGIYINVNNGRYQYKKKFYSQGLRVSDMNDESSGMFYGQYEKDYFNTPQEALSSGIEYTINNLI